MEEDYLQQEHEKFIESDDFIKMLKELSEYEEFLKNSCTE